MKPKSKVSCVGLMVVVAMVGGTSLPLPFSAFVPPPLSPCHLETFYINNLIVQRAVAALRKPELVVQLRGAWLARKGRPLCIAGVSPPAPSSWLWHVTLRPF